jgi:hypothetical protein
MVLLLEFDRKGGVMTKYQLEEFKKWLETDPNRKENLSLWEDIFTRRIITDAHLERLIVRGDCRGRLQQNWLPYREVAQKWLTERERERERESKWITVNNAIHQSLELYTPDFVPKNFYAITAEAKKRMNAKKNSKNKTLNFNGSNLLLLN